MGRTGYHQSRTSDLTRRQRQVLELIARGKTNGEIAGELGVTLDGAKWHVREILAKLGVDSREDAARIWRQDQSIGSRTLRRMAAVPASAMLGAAAGVAIVIVVAGIMMTFLDNDDEPVPPIEGETPVGEPTPTFPGPPETPTPVTPTPTFTPDEEDFLALALAIDEELQAGKVGLIHSRVHLEHVVCTGEHYPPQGIPEYPCEFVGDEFEYFVYDTGTHGSLMRVDGNEPFEPANSLLFFDAEATDGFGPGSPRVLSFRLSGADRATMLVTRIIPGGPGRPVGDIPPGRPPSRQVDRLNRQQIDGEWRLVGLGQSAIPRDIQIAGVLRRESVSSMADDGGPCSMCNVHPKP
jgi:DNA-binding CsgD family transcriptional regulator